jgi:hypothetical protein
MVSIHMIVVVLLLGFVRYIIDIASGCKKNDM